MTEGAGVVHNGDGLLASLVELDISSAFRHMHAYEEVARFSRNSGPTQLHELEYTGDLRTGVVRGPALQAMNFPRKDASHD
jgi:hypothetical protein